MKIIQSWLIVLSKILHFSLGIAAPLAFQVVDFRAEPVPAFVVGEDGVSELVGSDHRWVLSRVHVEAFSSLVAYLTRKSR